MLALEQLKLKARHCQFPKNIDDQVIKAFLEMLDENGNITAVKLTNILIYIFVVSIK